MSSLVADSRRILAVGVSFIVAIALVMLGSTARAATDTSSDEVAASSVLTLTPHGAEPITGTVEIVISKVAGDTQAELAGAKLATEDGKYSAEWTSGAQPQTLKVHPGNYVFSEVEARPATIAWKTLSSSSMPTAA